MYSFIASCFNFKPIEIRDDDYLKEPTWFGVLQKCNVLSKEEFMCIEKVLQWAREYKEVPKRPPKKASYNPRLKLPRINFIECNLKEYEKIRHDFLNSFPKWREIRIRNIELMESVGYYLQNQRRETNEGRLIGSTVSAAGGVMSIVGGIAAPLTFGLTAPIAGLGAILTGVGSIGNLCSSVITFCTKVQKLEEVSNKLKEEEVLFRKIANFFRLGNQMLEMFSNVLHFTDKGVFNELLQEISKALPQDVDKTFVHDKMKLLVMFLGKRLLLMSEIPMSEVLCMIMTIAFMCRRSRMMFDLTAFAMKVSLENYGAGVVGVGSSLLDLTSTSKAGLGKALFKGVLKSVGVALDVIALSDTIKDMENGSVSEEGEKLKEFAEYLLRELREFEEKYDEILKQLGTCYVGEGCKKTRQAALSFLPRRNFVRNTKKTSGMGMY